MPLTPAIRPVSPSKNVAESPIRAPPISALTGVKFSITNGALPHHGRELCRSLPAVYRLAPHLTIPQIWPQSLHEAYADAVEVAGFVAFGRLNLEL